MNADYYAPERASAITVLPAASEISIADEINHRVANSLQLLSALVSIEARRMVDPLALAALDMTQRRIVAIAGVHRHLYRGRDAKALDLAGYLDELGTDLEQSCGNAIAGRNVRVDAEPMIMSSDKAMAIGIIVSELVGNACKYAYDPGEPGDVLVTLRSMPFGGFRLDVSDRGRGIRADAMPQGTGLGAKLIKMMAARLHAYCCWQDAQPGTRFVLLAGDL